MEEFFEYALYLIPGSFIGWFLGFFIRRIVYWNFKDWRK